MDTDKYLSINEIKSWMKSMDEDDLAHQIAYMREDGLSVRSAIGAELGASGEHTKRMISRCKRLVSSSASAFACRLRAWMEDPRCPNRIPREMNAGVAMGQLVEAYKSSGYRADGFAVCQNLEFQGWTVDADLVHIIDDAVRSSALDSAIWMMEFGQWK